MKTKRFLVLFLSVIMLVSLIACGRNKDKETDKVTESGQIDEITEPNETEGDPEVVQPVQDDTKHVMAFVMGGAMLPEYNGEYKTWNNKGEVFKHEPDKTTEDGLRDIASVNYPSIGLYDVTDPDYQEYMMQLCKMCYIDTLNYYVQTDKDILADETVWGKNFNSLVCPMLKKYGLSSSARIPGPGTYAQADGSVNKLFNSLVNMLGDTALKINGRPVIAQFSVDGITPDAVEAWKKDYAASHNGTEPFFMTIQTYNHLKSSGWPAVADGQFGWIELDEGSNINSYQSNVGVYSRYADLETAKINHDKIVNRAKNYKEDGVVTFYSESVTPAFDDVAVWAWGAGQPRKIEGGQNGELYEYKWQSVIKNQPDMVTIPTWDDWGEGTTIEPTLQYGIKYLEITRKYAAEYKGVDANTADLELPGWIYKIRKTTNDKAILADMDKASDLIAEGKYAEAEAIVKPYVASCGIPSASTEYFEYPTTPTTPLVQKVVEVESAPEVGESSETWKPVADTYVVSSESGVVDFGSEDKMIVKKSDDQKLTRRMYIKFNTSKTTLDKVGNAVLRLYCTYTSKDEAEKANRDINLYAVSSDWTENSFDWSTQPAVIEKISDVNTTSFTAWNWVEIDVTEYVKNHLGETITFSIWNEGVDSAGNHIEFRSRESANYEPKLYVSSDEVVGGNSDSSEVEDDWTGDDYIWDEPYYPPTPPVVDESSTPVVTGTTETWKPVADTYVANNSASDQGSDQLLRVKKDDKQKLTRNAYIKFNTTSTTFNEFTSAVLRLYCKNASAGEAEILSRDINVYAASCDWKESGFDWSNQPAVSEKIADVDSAAFVKGQWVEIDVTNYVKAHLGEKICFAIRNEGTDSADGHIDFYSSAVEGYEPQLVLTKQSKPTMKGDDEVWLPIADTYVVNAADNPTDFGSDVKLRVKKDDAQKITRRAFIKFDTTATSFGEATKATLRLECLYLSKDENEIAGRDINLYATSSDWNEGGFNWTTQPAVTEKIADIDSASFVGYQWIEIDVTDYIKAHLGETVTFSIWNEGIDSEGNYIDFHSRESARHEPQLVISGVEKGEDSDDTTTAPDDTTTEPDETTTEPEDTTTGPDNTTDSSDDPNEPTEPTGPETFYSISDTYVQNNGATDKGSDTLLQVKQDDVRTRRAFIKFDTRDTARRSVSEAKLRIKLEYFNPSSTLSSFDVNLYAVSSEWEEGTFTWDTQPTVIEKIADIDTTLLVGYSWVEIDVTDYVREHYGEIFTVAIFNDGTADGNGNFNICSEEFAGSEPQIVITFSEGGNNGGEIEPEDTTTEPEDTTTESEDITTEPNDTTTETDGTTEAPNEPTEPTGPETFYSISDTYVQNNGATDKGSDTLLQVKQDDVRTRRAFIKFDTRDTARRSVSEAKLRIKLEYFNPSSTLSSFDVNLYAVSSEWEEGTFTWDTQPTVIEKIADIDTTLLVGYSWVEIDVTDYVREHYGEIFTVAIFNDGTADGNGNFNICSEEFAGSEPQIVITFSEGGNNGGEIEPEDTTTESEDTTTEPDDTTTNPEDTTTEPDDTTTNPEDTTTGTDSTTEEPDDPIEPTGPETFYSIADTYVQNNGTTDKGSEALLQVKLDDVRTRRAFIKFDTRDTETRTVSNATLRIMLEYFNGSSTLSSFDVNLYAVSSEWEEGTFNWETQPAIIEKIADIDTASLVGGYKWLEIDVTDYVNAHYGEIFTLAIFNEGIADNNGNFSICSKESAGNEPQLIIE